ncbi:hypothetical protein [Granulicella sibirica]|uniref:Uncharacterized protein n=1 Tax=Granulicella sibirica TaxID=2479048 RepID=A0A4Q0T592_9BACT|nr:hypothetical protein [Granulicella sibirica]RXH58873.1 hypothetical protein GRAN_2183 [Granulicella sibirica]
MNKKTPRSHNQAAASQPLRRPALAIAASLAFAFASSVVAQQVNSSPILLAGNSLPDSPGALLAASARPDTEGTSSSLTTLLDPAWRDSGQYTSATKPMAARTDKYIAPGQPAPQLSVGNKVFLGLKDSVSPLAAFGWLISSGYEQATNGSPNYGGNARGFAQRLGASAARASSESIFSDSIAASILREDPRYYRMGRGNSPLKRGAYAISRVFISRTDSGRATPNISLLAGNLGGAFLTKAYYPSLNTSNTEVFKTFGGSLAGSAVGFGISEFLSGALNIIHNSKSVPD